jgi:hypothetical protein
MAAGHIKGMLQLMESDTRVELIFHNLGDTMGLYNSRKMSQALSSTQLPSQSIHVRDKWYHVLVRVAAQVLVQ